MRTARIPSGRTVLCAVVALAAVLAAAGCSAGSVRPARRAAGTPRTVHARPAPAAPSLSPTPDAGWAATHPDSRAIAGFADRVSVLPGGSVRLFVSTVAPSFRVTAYRIGWYGGALAGRVWTSAVLAGVAQRGAAEIPATRTDYAPWQPSLTVSTDRWPPGDYLFRLDASTGAQSFVPLTVRSPSTRGRLVILNGVTTWQAYNTWGGRSLYGGGPHAALADRAYAVSFDRPYALGQGAAGFLTDELPAVSFAEQLHLPLAYATDVDLHADPHLLDGAAGLVSLGHDEYWSAQMIDAALTARARGVNLAFLGANAVYRHIRFAATPLGPDRLEIDYKDAALDPVDRTDPREATQWSWEGPPWVRPPSVLTGTYYECNPVHADMVAADPTSWLLTGIVHAGEHLPGLVGSEYDRIDPAEPTPQPVDVLFHSPVTCRGKADFSDAAYYTTPSGAGVFDSGTSKWECALALPPCGDPATRAVVRAVTGRLLRAFAAGPAGRAHPPHDDLARLGIRTPPVPTASPG